jgi:dephospho-CoA kinase
MYVNYLSLPMKSNISSNENKPLKVGITGGIGSGKSVVCRVFANLGIPVFYADTVSRELTNQNTEIRAKLFDWYGSDIYLPNSELNRKMLAQIIFSDKFELEKVNNLVHPLVRKAFIDWTEHQSSPYVVQEAAILFESGQYLNFDHVVLVTASTETKIERVMKRDNLSHEQVVERMKNQWPDSKKLTMANDVVICNDQNMIIPQVIKIHDKLLVKWQNLESGLAQA